MNHTKKNQLVLLFIMSLYSAIGYSAEKNCNRGNSKNAINAMSFNIRMATKVDKENYWDFRRDYAADLIRFHNIDIAGMQEVLHTQLTDLLERLPEYDYIGVGREDGKEKGEYSAIIYKKDRFKLLESGTFWLAEDINAVGKKGWDGACERVATWGLFKDNISRKTFLYLNTHLDHVGKVARREGAKLILEKVYSFSKGYPAIVTGDFNSTSDEEPIQILTHSADQNKQLLDTRAVAPFVYGPSWTFHDFGRIPFEQRVIIDYIFIKGDIEVVKYGVLSENKGGLFPSDHCPVMSTLILK